MFSLHKLPRRILAYTFFNAFIVLIALQGFIHVEVAHAQDSLLSKGISWYISCVFKMYICVKFFEWIASQRTRINERDSTKEEGWKRAAMNMVFMLAPLDALQYLYLTQYFDFVDPQAPATASAFVWQYLTFIPKSLLLELIFDFCHYWTHRLAHKIKWLYRAAHEDHHHHAHPGPWTTYEQSFLDGLVSNMSPMLVAMGISSVCGPLRLTLWQLHLLMAYKIYTEVGGHTGIDTHAATFPQFPGIFFGLGTAMCLTSHDHYEHHRILRGNFSKRFRFWDVVFDTYIETNLKKPMKKAAVFGSALAMSSSAVALVVALQ